MKYFVKNNIKKFFRLFLAAIILTSSLLFGCDRYGLHGYTEFSAFSGTPVIIYTVGTDITGELLSRVETEFYSLNAEFSATDKGSAVYGINNSAAGEKTQISERFKAIFNECGYMRSFTQGKFDVAVYPLTELWRFAPDFPAADFVPPEKNAVTDCLLSVGSDKFDVTDDFVSKTVDGAKLDFGGALKGYAAETVGKILKDAGAKGGYVSCGGSSHYLISTDTLSIVHPRKEGNIITVKEKLTDRAASTSGDYEKYYSYNGKTYSHIIDPTTGVTAETGIASATVIAKNGLKSDALTTALCLFSHDPENHGSSELVIFLKGLALSDDFADAWYYVVYDDGQYKQILTNKKQGENFTLSDNSYTVYYIS
ncbi:MAG: FAD:protein FMN transferase [Clostridia bacterium]|nr:FAD:protein FMN transferase [Clostridia bacterium]